MHFADRVSAAVDSKGSPVMVGLDPRPESLPPHLLEACRAEFGDTVQAIGEAFWRFNRGIIDAVHDVVPAVKPQLAFYEQYGMAGLGAYTRTTKHAREAGLLVVADGKRNDIGSTASAYAEAFLGEPRVFDQLGCRRLRRRCSHRQPVSPAGTVSSRLLTVPTATTGAFSC